jgi:hypothetical protein
LLGLEILVAEKGEGTTDDEQGVHADAEAGSAAVGVASAAALVTLG